MRSAFVTSIRTDPPEGVEVAESIHDRAVAAGISLNNSSAVSRSAELQPYPILVVVVADLAHRCPSACAAVEWQSNAFGELP